MPRQRLSRKKYRIPCAKSLGLVGGIRHSGFEMQETINLGWPEPIEPGNVCLHPAKRNICESVYVGSMLGFCAALEGDVIKGGPHDNSSVARILTSSGYPK